MLVRRPRTSDYGFSTTDQAEIERTKRLISELYADRVRLHQNP
jgi:hypothetical protein